MASEHPRKPLLHAEPSETLRGQFSSAPWTAKIFQDPGLHPFTARLSQHNTTGDTFCGKTLATEDTISAWQSFYRNPESPGKFYEIVTLLKLGSGMNGHVDTCHGGFISLVLDEVIGNAAEYERPFDKATMTAYLKVDYKSPIHTPNVILARAWLEKREGRKMWGRGTVEDGEGKVMATGEALFLVVEAEKLNLKGRL